MTQVMTTVTKLGNRAVPREELRGRIYQAAIAVFREQGFEGATVEEITVRARVAKGTFFNFYRTKVEVLAAYYGAIDKRIMALREAMDPRSPERSLAEFAGRAESVLRAEGPLLLDLLRTTLSVPSLRDIDYASGQADEEQFAAFFETGRRIGAIDARVDPAKAAGVVLDIWSGAMRRWAHAGGRLSLAAMFAERLHVVFQGLGRAGGATP